jgi:hypothetical protein
VNRDSTFSGSPLVPLFHFENNPHANGGLANAFATDTADKVIWCGTPGCDVDAWDRKTKREVERRFLAEKDSLVAYVSDDTLDAGYSGFCKQVLGHAMSCPEPGDIRSTGLVVQHALRAVRLSRGARNVG